MIVERVRKFRESHNFLLRQLAAKLDMDTANENAKQLLKKLSPETGMKVI